MYCTKCGKEVGKTDLYCRCCGNQTKNIKESSPTDSNVYFRFSILEKIRAYVDKELAEFFSTSTKNTGDIGFAHLLLATTVISATTWIAFREIASNDIYRTIGGCDLIHIINTGIYCIKGWLKEIISINKENFITSLLIFIATCILREKPRKKISFIKTYGIISSLYVGYFYISTPQF